MSVTLDAESYLFPRDLLIDCGSALLLFCSGRMGATDGHWIREAGLTDVTCVDWDEKTLEPFAAEYPADWDYVQADAFEWVKTQQRRWDLVSADAPSQWDHRVAEMLQFYCASACRYVTATILGTTEIPPAPEGWCIADVIDRALYQGRTYRWLVLQAIRPTP